MKTQSLCGVWQLSCAGMSTISGTVPGSVYSILLENNQMEDPFYRDNELNCLALMEKDYTFTRRFTADLSKHAVLLRCDGLDTLAVIRINGAVAGCTENMHRVYEFDITNLLCAGENEISITFSSPTKWIRSKNAADYLGGSPQAMEGFPHLRKAHCMFGWDWGPRLPDMGIWRDISLLTIDSARLEDVHIRQRHSDGAVYLRVDVTQSGSAKVAVELTLPDGGKRSVPANEEFLVENPQLWWPHGYGAQPLYTVEVSLLEHNAVVDSVQKRIGLRTLTVLREKDEFGEGFAQCVNGMPFFAMGADYIPEDNLLSRVTPERTRLLLEQCVQANFNTLRVWGGGYYPNDFFFDLCDELGLVVWQDFMFACANYHLTPEFEENIKAEFRDNICRLRHHASLALWCGNNEMEMFQLSGEFDGTFKTKSDYVRMFEHVIPASLREYDPDTFYWPASPSSGGAFDAPNDPNRGDVHYWDVWHGNKPFAEYRKFFFRYCSEFGFQAFPSMKTVAAFTLPEERNIFSRTMEMHQRNEGANGKIMHYLSQTFLYPTSLDTLVYASQLLQADAVRYGVEHWRRNRGRCMGAIYWQLNDIWPVASWASIDYYGRWKALHYYAKRFFAPIMISAEETGETTNRIAVVTEPSEIEASAKLCVANETREDVTGTVRWELRRANGEIVCKGSETLCVPALSSVWMDKIIFPDCAYLSEYMSYAFCVENEIVSEGTVLFTAPKHFHFQDPHLRATISGDEITITADAFAKGVEIDSLSSDFILSNNYFDLNAGSTVVRILKGTPENLRLRSVFDIR